MARRVFIPKPGSDERRPLSIPSVRDRVVQAAVKIVLEPVFEADMLACSFGFRPRRATHDALRVLIDESFRGDRWVVETDVADCFGSIARWVTGRSFRRQQSRTFANPARRAANRCGPLRRCVRSVPRMLPERALLPDCDGFDCGRSGHRKRAG